MKKCKRWITVLLISVMCLSLCGCQDLEDMRAAHARWQDDGSILWNGDTYRELENVPEEMQIYVGQLIHLTDADVPVLLSETFGSWLEVDANGVLLQRYANGKEHYYCRDDQYDEIAKYLSAGIDYDSYFYNYWDYRMDDPSAKLFYYLTDEEYDVMEMLQATLEFAVIDNNFFYNYSEDEYSVLLGKCDERHLFTEEHVLEILYKNGSFYLVKMGEIAEVPTEYYPTMKSIVKTFYKAEIDPFK